MEYVNDPSNFQPDFTIRNAIRHCLDRKEPDPTFADYPGAIGVELKRIDKAAAKYPDLNISLSSSREQLREAVKKVAEELDQVDAKGLSSIHFFDFGIKLICLLQWMSFSKRIGCQLLPEVSWFRFRHSWR